MFSGSQPHGADHPEFSGYRPLNPVVRPSSFVVRSTRPFEWKGTTTLVYKPTGTGFKNIVRKVLLGEGESDLPFQVRYFEIGRGGYSSLESHHHRHAVVVIRGRGKIFLKTRVHDLRPYDSVYIGKDAVHQFHQVGAWTVRIFVHGRRGATAKHLCRRRRRRNCGGNTKRKVCESMMKIRPCVNSASKPDAPCRAHSGRRNRRAAVPIYQTTSYVFDDTDFAAQLSRSNSTATSTRGS